MKAERRIYQELCDRLDAGFAAERQGGAGLTHEQIRRAITKVIDEMLGGDDPAQHVEIYIGPGLDDTSLTLSLYPKTALGLTMIEQLRPISEDRNNVH